MLLRPLLILCAGLLLLMQSGLFSQEEENGDPIPPLATTLSAAAAPSIVSIEHWKTQPTKVRHAICTGFFVDSGNEAQPWILSSLGEVEPTDTFHIALGRTLVVGRLIASDPTLRLALFQLPAATTHASLHPAAASLSAQEAGANVFLVDSRSTVGTPATVGKFACREPISPLGPTHLRLHFALKPAPPGSPIFDEKKQLIGLLSLPVEGLNNTFFAVPSERIAKFLRDVRTHGKPVRPVLGIAVNEAFTAPAILGSRENSPAAKAGLAPNDVILRIGTTKIANLQELVDAIDLLDADKEVEIQILRGQAIKQLKITPKLKPDVSI